MSKKYRKQRPRKGFPWPLVVFGGVLLIAAALVWSSRGGGDGGGIPSIAVDQQNIDFGYVKLGEYRSIRIQVTNTGDGLLRFKETPYIEVLEGCCPPELTVGSMTLKPGESTYIQSPNFMMHEGMDGKHDFGIHLLTNDPDNPDLVLHVLSDWGP